MVRNAKKWINKIWMKMKWKCCNWTEERDESEIEKNPFMLQMNSQQRQRNETKQQAIKLKWSEIL